MEVSGYRSMEDQTCRWGDAKVYTLPPKCKQTTNSLRKAFIVSQLVHFIDERAISNASHVIRVATNQILIVINGRSLLFGAETFGVHANCRRVYSSVHGNGNNWHCMD